MLGRCHLKDLITKNRLMKRKTELQQKKKKNSKLARSRSDK